MDNPTPAEIKALRESVQGAKGMNITEATDYCAKAVHTTRRSWQRWEEGDQKMNLVYWELANIKLGSQRIK